MFKAELNAAQSDNPPTAVIDLVNAPTGMPTLRINPVFQLSDGRYVPQYCRVHRP